MLYKTRPEILLDRLSGPLLIVCALVMTGFVVRRELATADVPKAKEASMELPGRPLQPGYQLTGGRLIGDPAAPVRIVEIAEFQCPFCARSAEMLHELMEKSPGRFAVEFHHLPLSMHEHARPAANASECAAEQGRFSDFYFVTFANQVKIGKWTWTEFAKRAGVPDIEKFRDCVDKESFANRVEDDARAVTALGFSGTPSWIVRDTAYGGAASMPQLERWVTAARPVVGNAPKDSL